MHPANGEKIEALNNTTLLPTTSPRDPEKQSLNVEGAISQPDNMPRIQHCFFTLLILVLLGLTIVSAASSQLGHGISDAIAQEKLRFQELLDSVEPNSLHEVLHTHMKDRYKHGVYQEDKHAMEVVHQENAVVAHSLLELAKRQSGNGTTIVVTTTGATVTETTTTATHTANPPTTTSDSSPPPSTSESNSPAAPTTTPDQQTTSPSAPSTSSTPLPSTDVKSSSSDKATSPPASRSVTQQILYTTTLPNGGVSTITSITVVPADQAQTAGAGSSTNTAKASLQTNSAKSGKALDISGVLGALCLMVVVSGL